MHAMKARWNPVSLAVSSLSLDPFAIEFEVARFRYQSVSVLQSGQHLDVASVRLAKSYVVQRCNCVLIENEDSLQLPALDHSGAWDQKGLPFSARKLRPAEESGPNLRVRGQLDFYVETAAAWVCGWNNLDHLARQRIVADSIYENLRSRTNTHCRQIALVHGYFQSIPAHILDGEDGHSGRSQSSSVDLLLSDDPIKRSANRR